MRLSVTPFVELLVLAGAILIATASYFIISSGGSSTTLLTPSLVAFLLVANLVPGIALLVLLGRRIAMIRAARSPIGGRGQLHVRLVALFSVIAAVPTLLVVIFASFLFQYGVEFWYSGRAQAMVENAQTLAHESYSEMLSYVDKENLAMAQDLSRALTQYHLPIEDQRFQALYGQDVYQRSLAESVIFTVSKAGEIHSEALVNPYERDLDRAIDAAAIAQLRQGKASVTSTSSERTTSITAIPNTNFFLYSARVTGAGEMTARMHRAQAVIADYQALLTRSRSLQLKFNAALLLVSLLIVGIAVWIALEVADRLVRPVGELVAAAHRVATGDLTARVPVPLADDEVGTLGKAFNQMTVRLQQQTGALESRRALIEAVMSGVTAGVISIAADGTIRLINRSAAMLLHTGDENLVGRPLAAISPELSALIGGDTREAIVEVEVDGDQRTLAVKIATADEGPILTFDDITGQLLDQRRAAWSDVARRIAHEIKNPLTPIQLAAERLQRRYAKQLPNDDGTFTRLTETIVRQVGDLRRMVDEFSSFARMPKPIFREESLVDIARQALFLHEVAHPLIKFELVHDDPGPELVCDRRQIGQALTNIVKNAVEAIDARGEGSSGTIVMTLAEQADTVTLCVADDGVGLPVARDRLVEPYVTTRARGTGLGLAIVKKIVEEHCGTISFADREGGGTKVKMNFDTAALAAIDTGDRDSTEGEDRRTPELTRNRN
ncbi:MAG: sensor histidine kinase [Sphingomonas bacterium]|uniref:sensor histidine kinase n=1 Tax=Sphingomonas bacterium TaxID=1895847 RepID=UPI00262BA038|nr:ATP-binding protein [Sphingomonas bacterium]MDB5707178.1 sensor histidine kinase [Sphingomonas bacterium]